MRVHSLERPSALQPRQLDYVRTYRGWVRPAWMWSCIVGCVVATTISALVLVVVSVALAQYRSGIYEVPAVELVAMTAALEGGLIGYFQWRVLRRLFPTMTSGPWVGATMIAAASGCVLSWLPTSFALTAAIAARIGDLTPGPAVVIRVCLVTGALVGLVWGVSQYAVLRLHAHRAGSWIVASTMSWTISFICLYFAAFWPDRTVSPLIHVGLAAFAGLILGSALGLLQGRVLAGLHSRLLVSTHPGSDRTRSAV